jgi:hypothetical protein|tara:strand:+ start:3546 stop:3920 length:375 start_codon:yes stop_codon:yes gene_type:complete
VPFVDFSSIKSRESHRIVPVPSWGGDVRLNKPSALILLPIVQMQEKYQRDDDGRFTSDVEAIEFATELLSKMIANEESELQFDSVDGKARLGRDFAAIQSLIEEATDLCGLGEDAAKKNNGSPP